MDELTAKEAVTTFNCITSERLVSNLKAILTYRSTMRLFLMSRVTKSAFSGFIMTDH